jgi:hypothetical protein
MAQHRRGGSPLPQWQSLPGVISFMPSHAPKAIVADL